MSIDKLEADFRGIRWGIASARQGELILPDTFGHFAFVPVTPTTCLVCGSEDGELSLAQIEEINRPDHSRLDKRYDAVNRLRLVPA